MQNDAQNILDRVLSGIGYKKPIEFKFGQMKTADGQNTFESENFQPSDACFIVTEDGNIKCPSGTYDMEDGSKIVVDESGLIAEVISAETKEEMQNDPMKEQIGKPVAQEESQKPKTIIETMTKETQFAEANPTEEIAKEEQTMAKTKLQIKAEELVGEGEIAEKVAEAIVSIIESPEAKEMVEEFKKAKMGYKMSSQANDSTILKAIENLEMKLSAIAEENEQLKNALASEGNRTFFNPEEKSSPKLNFRIGAKREETIEDRVFNSLF
jgi:hypothetical protein